MGEGEKVKGIRKIRKLVEHVKTIATHCSLAKYIYVVVALCLVSFYLLK